MDISGATVVTDALHCQKKTAKEILAAGADYVFSVKKNQKQLYADVSEIIDFKLTDKYEQLNAPLKKTTRNEKSHGRIEKRTALVTNEVEWLRNFGKWHGIQSLGAIETDAETRYYISSRKLSPLQRDIGLFPHPTIEITTEIKSRRKSHVKKNYRDNDRKWHLDGGDYFGVGKVPTAGIKIIGTICRIILRNFQTGSYYTVPPYCGCSATEYSGLHTEITRRSFDGCVMWAEDIPEDIAVPISQIDGIGERSVKSWSGIKGAIANGFGANIQFTFSMGNSEENDKPIYYCDEDWVPHSGGWFSTLVTNFHLKRFFKPII